MFIHARPHARPDAADVLYLRRASTVQHGHDDASEDDRLFAPLAAQQRHASACPFCSAAYLLDCTVLCFLPTMDGAKFISATSLHTSALSQAWQAAPKPQSRSRRVELQGVVYQREREHTNTHLLDFKAPGPTPHTVVPRSAVPLQSEVEETQTDQAEEPQREDPKLGPKGNGGTFACVCVHIYIYIYTHKNKQRYIRIYSSYITPTYLHTCIHTCVYIYIYVCVYTHICTYVSISIRTYIHTHLYTCASMLSCVYIYIYIYVYAHPLVDRPRCTNSVSLAGDSAKIGSCHIPLLRKSTATCTNLKLVVSRNSCIYEQIENTMYSGFTNQMRAQVGVAAMTTNSEAKPDRSYQAQRLRESFDVH